jgi:hypothetical protein
MKIRKTGREGMALIFALMTMIVILGTLGVVAISVSSSRSETQLAYNDTLVEEAAKAGVDLIVQRLWDQYRTTSGNTTNNVANYQYYLTNTLGIPLDEDLNGNGTMDRGEDLNGNGQFDLPPASNDARGVNLLDEPMVFKDQTGERSFATLDSVHVTRYDTPWESMLTLRSTASLDGRQKTAIQVIRIGGEPLDHPKFAILANNINCILCHADIRSINLDNNTDTSKYGSFDRVKIAALESLMVRTNEADSFVAGTMYTRGKVYNQSGGLLSDSAIASSKFKSRAFSDQNGKITQNSSGGMTTTSFKQASVDADGKPAPFANLYKDYSTDRSFQTDGAVPNSFPAPYPDENENRYVDDEEFNKIVNAANGNLDFNYGTPEEAGSLKAGVAYGVPTGSAYTGTGLPASSNSALSVLSSTGSYDGNLILVGTEDDPILINNTVAVNGDLVLAGKIKGDGRMLVRGNTYIVGDVTYADDPGQYGKYDVNPADPTDYKENAFALVSGGSVMMGDYLTIRGVNASAQDSAQFPTWSQYSIHTRDKNKSNTVSGKVLEWGYFDKWSVDRNTKARDPNRFPGTPIPVANHPGDQYSFTQSELMLFNNIELKKAIADPDYIPRFYGLRESQPNNIFVYDSTNEHSVKYSETGVKYLADYLVAKGLPLSIMNRAAYHYTSPKSNWISEATLRNIWYADEMTRPSSGRSWKFDGLLYSNNSIFSIVRSYTRHYSNTKGKMDIRGGIVAADLGVFVPEGFVLKYDPRVERFLKQSDTTRPVFARASFYMVGGDGTPEAS